MKSTSIVPRFIQTACILPLAATLAACSVAKDTPPLLTGPSEFGLSLTMAATPDVLMRDGSSMSTVTLTARNADGGGVAGQRVMLGLSPSNGGTLSNHEVVTGGDGRVTFELMAPPTSTAVDMVSIVATPVGQNYDNAVPRTMSVRLVGPAAPAAAFAYTPATPERLQLVTFDASATTVGGAACGDACTYTWKFGNEGSATGRVVNYRFQNTATYTVQLTVTSPAGIVATRTENVVVSGETMTLTISFSPNNPQVGDNVIFDGRGSIASSGASIVEYQWDFGNGSTASGATANTSFGMARSYNVRLTVRDSFGRTGTRTIAVPVAEPDED
jgi:PKD repeat protein